MIIVSDLEFTTWDGAQDRGWTGPGEFRAADCYAILETLRHLRSLGHPLVSVE